MKKEARKTVVSEKGKTLKGTVVSNSMKDTLVVSVQRYVMLPKIRKYVRIHKKYMAHAPGHTHNIGDSVVIQSCRPLSKNKHFMISL